MSSGGEAKNAAIAFCGRGLVRAGNEDSIAVDGTPLEHEKMLRRELTGAEDHLIIVADGMGGHVKGELASQLTVQTISDFWKNSRPNFEPVEAARTANQAVYDAMRTNPSLRGMGATVVGAHI